jgi:hypothetical protein
MGYTETSKREELFDPLTRFLLVHTHDYKLKGENVKVTTSTDGEEELLGYCSFRFDTEETLSSRDAEVMYWLVDSKFPPSWTDMAWLGLE